MNRNIQRFIKSTLVYYYKGGFTLDSNKPAINCTAWTTTDQQITTYKPDHMMRNHCKYHSIMVFKGFHISNTQIIACMAPEFLNIIHYSSSV